MLSNLKPVQNILENHAFSVFSMSGFFLLLECENMKKLKNYVIYCDHNVEKLSTLLLEIKQHMLISLNQAKKVLENHEFLVF